MKKFGKQLHFVNPCHILWIRKYEANFESKRDSAGLVETEEAINLNFYILNVDLFEHYL